MCDFGATAVCGARLVSRVRAWQRTADEADWSADPLRGDAALWKIALRAIIGNR